MLDFIFYLPDQFIGILYLMYLEILLRIKCLLEMIKINIIQIIFKIKYYSNWERRFFPSFFKKNYHFPLRRRSLPCKGFQYFIFRRFNNKIFSSSCRKEILAIAVNIYAVSMLLRNSCFRYSSDSISIISSLMYILLYYLPIDHELRHAKCAKAFLLFQRTYAHFRERMISLWALALLEFLLIWSSSRFLEWYFTIHPNVVICDHPLLKSILVTRLLTSPI